MPELSFLEKLFVFFQHVVPQRLLSRLTGTLADTSIEPIRKFLIKQFIGQFDVNMDEAKEPDPDTYHSFNQFFTRELKEGVRPIDDSTESLAMPADGAISEAGKIENGRLLQAKGHHYTLKNLCGDDDSIADLFEEGYFCTVYLSPRDYHRVHMPCDGKLISTRYVPGKLFSVNDVTAQSVPHLFARNERLVCLFESETGPFANRPFAMVLVGAMIVAGIETVWSGQVTPQSKIATKVNYNEDIALKKGEEMGRFKLGSTVILLLPKDSVDAEDFVSTNEKDKAVKMGERLATLA